jgi:hypothetical protein
MPLIHVRFHPELPRMISLFDVLPHLTCYFMCCSTLKLALAIFVYSLQIQFIQIPRDQDRERVYRLLRELANAGSIQMPTALL